MSFAPKASTPLTLRIVAAIAVICATGVVLFPNVRQFAREAVMPHVTSSHYLVLWPRGMVQAGTVEKFARDRDPLLETLEKKLGDPGASSKLRIIFEQAPPVQSAPGESGEPRYSVRGTTIRTQLSTQGLQLPSSADARALLDAEWGAAGNRDIARWTAIWLAGDWQGQEIGMAAAQVEEQFGHQRVGSLLDSTSGAIASAADRQLLGAAWISAVADFGGVSAVHKVYAARTQHVDVAQIARVLRTSPAELERKWQMWMYAYMAGMPSAGHSAAMPMNMSMPGMQ